MHRAHSRTILTRGDAKRKCMDCHDLKPPNHFKGRSMICKGCKQHRRENFLKAQERRGNA